MGLYRRGLKVEDDVLYGKRLLRPWVPIESGDITDVRTYCWNNPFLKVFTRKGKFVLGRLVPGYEAVVQHIEERTSFKVSVTLAHKYNMVVFRLPLSKIVGYLFKRKRNN